MPWSAASAAARINAEAALKRQRDALMAVFEQMDDAYLRARRDDVQHVSARILRILLKQERSLPVGEPEAPAEPNIIVADDITPADIILLAQAGVRRVHHRVRRPRCRTRRFWPVRTRFRRSSACTTPVACSRTAKR